MTYNLYLACACVDKMADEEDTIEIVEEEDEDDEEEAAFDEVFEILAVSEELALALQESEEGVELLQLCKEYIRAIKGEEEQYEETISQCQVYQDRLSNENAKLVETEGRLRKELESEAGAHAEASKEVSRLSDELETCKQAKEELAAEKDHALAALQSQVDALTEENQSLREQVQPPPEVPGDRYELLRLLDRRQLEVTRLTEEWSSMSKKLNEAVKAKHEEQLKVDELNSKVSSQKLHEQLLEQEKQMLQNRLSWLGEESQRSTSQLNSMRQERAEEVGVLQSRLAVVEEELKTAAASVTHLKEEKGEVERKMEDVLKQLREQRTSSAQLEDQFHKEIAAQTKLTDLYKSSSSDAERRVDELLQAVEHLQELLKEAEEEKNAATELSRRVVEEQEGGRAELEAEVAQLRKELSTANELVSTKTSELNISMSSPSAAQGSAQQQHGGLTVTQIYIKFAQSQEELRQAQDEVTRLTNYLEHIRQELDAKGPVIYQLKVDYDASQQAVHDLQDRLTAAQTECGGLRLELDDALGQAVAKDRECHQHKMAARDLRQQVTALLKEVEEARGGVVSTSYHADDGGDVDEMDGAITSSAEVISKRLTTFRSLEELQKRNEELLAVVRELSAQNEKMEEEMGNESVKELKLKLDSAMGELGQLKEARQRQTQMVEAVVRQRDMYKLMVAQSTPLPFEKTPSPIRPSAPKSPLVVDLEGRQELQARFDEYRKERDENEKMLRKQLDELREEKSKEKMINAKLAAKVEYATEREKMLQSTNSSLKREVDLLRDKSQQFSGTLSRHLSSIEQLTQDLLKTKGDLARAEFALKSAAEEKEILSQAERRARQQYESVLSQQKQQNVLLTNLQTIQSNLDQSEFETKTKLGTQIESLERELLLARRKVEMEEERGQKVVESFRGQITELEAEVAQERTRHENTTAELSRTREELGERSGCVSKLEGVVKELEQKLKGAQVRLAEVQTDPESEVKRKVRILEKKLADIEAAKVSVESQLQSAKENAEHFKALSLSNEAALAEVNSTSKELQQDMEGKLKEACAKIDELTSSLEVERNEWAGKEEERRIVVEQLEQTVSDLRAEVSSLEAKLSSAESELEDVAKERDSAVGERQHLMEGNKELQSRYEQELVQHAKAVQSLAEVKEEISDVRQRAAQAESQVEGAHRELEDVRVSCDGRIAAVTEDHEKLQARCEELEGQNTLLHSQVERLSMQLVTEQSSHTGDDTSSMVSSVVSVGMEPTGDQVWEIVRYVRREKEIAETKCDLAVSESARFKQKCEQLSQQLQEAEETLRQERERTQVMSVTASQHAELLDRLESLNLLRDSNRLLREENTSLVDKLSAAEGKSQALEEELAPLKENLKQLTAQKDSLIAESTALKNEVSRWQMRTAQLIEQYNKIDPEEYKRLVNEGDEKNNEIEKLKERLSASQGEAKSLSQEVDSVRSQLTELQASCDSKEEELQTQKQSLEARDKLIREKDTLMKKLRELGKNFRAKYDAARKEVDELKGSLSSQEKVDSQAVLEKEKQIEELSAKQSSLEQANVELQGKVAELEKNATEQEGREKDVKKALALVKQRWSKSKAECEQLKAENQEQKRLLELAEQSQAGLQTRSDKIKAQLESRISKLESDLALSRQEKPSVLEQPPMAAVKPTPSVVQATSRGKPIAQAHPLSSMSSSPAVKQLIAVATPSSSGSTVNAPSQKMSPSPGQPSTSIGTATKIVHTVPPVVSRTASVSPQVAMPISPDIGSDTISSQSGVPATRSLKRPRTEPVRPSEGVEAQPSDAPAEKRPRSAAPPTAGVEEVGPPQDVGDQTTKECAPLATSESDLGSSSLEQVGEVADEGESELAEGGKEEDMEQGVVEGSDEQEAGRSTELMEGLEESEVVGSEELEVASRSSIQDVGKSEEQEIGQSVELEVGRSEEQEESEFEAQSLKQEMGASEEQKVGESEQKVGGSEEREVGRSEEQEEVGGSEEQEEVGGSVEQEADEPEVLEVDRYAEPEEPHTVASEGEEEASEGGEPSAIELSDNSDDEQEAGDGIEEDESEAGDEELEEGELPSDEDEIEIDASSELTVQPAPEIEQDEEDFSDHQAVSEVSGTSSVQIVAVSYTRPSQFLQLTLPSGGYESLDATVPQTPDMGAPKVPGQRIPSPVPAESGPPIGSSVAGAMTSAEADSSQEEGLPSLAETHVDFGVSGKVIKKEEASADSDLPEGEGSSQNEPMEPTGEEPGDNRVGSSSQQESSTKAAETCTSAVEKKSLPSGTGVRKSFQPIVFDIHEKSEPAKKPIKRSGGPGRGRGRGRGRGQPRGQ